jgi:hypothetical protein
MLAAMTLSGQPLAPEVLALSRAKTLVRQTVAALANCACLESLARGKTDKKGKAAENSHDTLQIEVTTIGDREMFSWPGRPNQGDTFVEDPAALVGYGLASSGQFTSMLKTIFLDGFAATPFHGAATFRSRPALEFDFSVSPVFTHSHLTTHGVSVTVGAKGSFWIDPQTSELLALSTEATEIPPDFGIRSAFTQVIYAPMYLKDDRVVLPQTASTVVEDSDGSVSVNQLEFSHCRALFSSESSIAYAGQRAPVTHESSPSEPMQQPIPGRLPLPLRLGTPLSAHSAIGERFSATVDADIRSHGKTIVKKGAAVNGRVRWIETTVCPQACLIVGVELLTVVDAEGASRPVYATLRQVEPESKVKIDITRVDQTTEALPFGARRLASSSQTIRIPEIPGVGAFFALTPDLTTPPEMLMVWMTESPRK